MVLLRCADMVFGNFLKKKRFNVKCDSDPSDRWCRCVVITSCSRYKPVNFGACTIPVSVLVKPGRGGCENCGSS